MKKLLVGTILSMTASLSAASAEWREVLNFNTTTYDTRFLQCELRLKRISSNASAIQSYQYFPLSYQSHSSDPLDTIFLHFNLQQALIPSAVMLGDQGSLSQETADLIRDEIQGKAATSGYIWVHIKLGNIPELLLSFSYDHPNGGATSSGEALNRDHFKLEADCSNTKFPGDANHDSCVDLRDVYTWYSNMLSRNRTGTNTFGARFEDGDFDENGILDHLDMNILVNNYLRGCNVFANVGPTI